MRQDLIDYLQTQNLGSYVVATELPWNENGLSLYLKNLKKIYVDVDEFVNEPLLLTFDGVYLKNETTRVRVYFANDAKQLTSNYDEIVSIVKSATNMDAANGYSRREADVNTTFEDDKLVTEIELRYIKLT